MQLSYNVKNTQRAIGTRLSSHITRKFGMTGLKEETITVRLRGSAGQSLGAFAVQGLKLEVHGDANDYVGKGLSGGLISIRPMAASPLVPQDHTIIGNTVLYGATSGKLFASGQAGERLAVRNSGAIAVVEGCGSNGCEYMTGGEVVVLGHVGSNFGAGMTGGMAFAYDPDHKFENQINLESIGLYRLSTLHWANHLKARIEEHFRHTSSQIAAKILSEWDKAASQFWHIVPHEVLPHLSHPVIVDNVGEAIA